MNPQFKRKVILMVTRPESKGNNPSAYVPQSTIDLSDLHMQFKTSNQDEEGPSNCSVRLFNMARSTVDAIIKYNYSEITLLAGYESAFGLIFKGNIKQFRTGRINATDTYLDILAADGDLGYNFATINTTLSANANNPAGVQNAIAQAGAQFGLTLDPAMSATGGTKPRGKVLFGMLRGSIRNYAGDQKSTWSIQNGKITVIPLSGYKREDAVILTATTGLVGLPEQTTDGLRVRCLLNPKITVGGRVWIDNKSVNQTIQNQNNIAPIPFNQWSTPQFLASVANDGYYRVYVAEHEGDSRGQAWYTDLVCLAIDNSTKNVKPYG